MHRCVHKRVHRVLVDVSVSVRKCVCTCSQVDSCTGTFAHVYVSMGVHECAQVCTGAQGAVHVGAHVCKYGCTQKCSRVFACGHTPSAHTCAQVSVHKRAQACTSAPVGVCAHVCVCWPAPCTLSSPHVRREHTHSTLRTPGEPPCKHTRVHSHRCPSAERIRRHPPPGAPRGGVGSHVSAVGGLAAAPPLPTDCAPPPIGDSASSTRWPSQPNCCSRS